jgi:glucose-1-phosphate thymidylyltransferase
VAVKGLILANHGSGALLEVANRPILHHALDAMAAAGVREVAVLGPASTEASLRASGSDVRGVSYLPAPRHPGVAAALLAAERFVDGSGLVVQQGDGLLVDDLGSLVGGLERDGQDALILLHRRERPRRDVGQGTHTDVAGAQLFGPRFVDVARGALERHRASGDLAPVLADVRRSGGRVETRLVDGWRAYEGDPDELLALNRQVLDRLLGGTVDLPDCRIQGRVVVDPTASVRDTVIHGPAVIGAGCTLAGAFIGPYSAIGRSVRIEGAEIEDSIVLPGASIMHIGGRISASVVGRNARIFRDFTLPRALRLQVGDGARVALR